MGSIVLLDLMGGVALLLWGLHMVHSSPALSRKSATKHWRAADFGIRMNAFANRSRQGLK
jgi:phosphate:Na+ symporter